MRVQSGQRGAVKTAKKYVSQADILLLCCKFYRDPCCFPELFLLSRETLKLRNDQSGTLHGSLYIYVFSTDFSGRTLSVSLFSGVRFWRTKRDVCLYRFRSFLKVIKTVSAEQSINKGKNKDTKKSWHVNSLNTVKKNLSKLKPLS